MNEGIKFMYFTSMRGALGKAYSALRQCTYNFEDWSANYIRLAPHKNLFPEPIFGSPKIRLFKLRGTLDQTQW